MKTKVQIFEEKIKDARNLLKFGKMQRDEFKEYFKQQAKKYL